MLSELASGLRNPRSIARFVKSNAPIWFYRLTSDSYTEAYRKHINKSVKENGRDALGGWGTGIGRLQFEFLKSQGLEPSHSLLDLGCGTLRGGKHFIEYLNTGQYTGMDLSESAIEQGKEYAGNELIEAKGPRFLINDDLQFHEFAGNSFDYVIAQSVLSHLKIHQIEECFENVHRILEPESKFYATYFNKSDAGASSLNGYVFSYEFEVIERLAEDSGLVVRELSKDDYPHPRNQRMLELQLNQQ